MEESLSMKAEKSMKELLPSEIKFSEKCVRDCYAVLDNWPAIFDDSTTLISLASGKHADKEVKDDLLNAQEIGEKSLVEFIEKRLVEKSVAFYDPIKKKNLRTFNPKQARKVVKIKQKEVLLKADRKMFARLLVIQRSRSVDLREVLQYSLGPIAWSLANEDGSIYKSVKSKLLDALECKMQSISEIPDDGALIFDGMCIIQQLPPGLATFGHISDLILRRIT